MEDWNSNKKKMKTRRIHRNEQIMKLERRGQIYLIMKLLRLNELLIDVDMLFLLKSQNFILNHYTLCLSVIIS